MNELEKQLAELVKRGMEAAEKTGEFVIDQSPELLQEFYRWHFIESFLGALFCIVAIFTVYKIFKLLGREEEGDDDLEIMGLFYDDIGGGFLSVISFIVSICFAISFFVNIKDALFVLVAPKLYLIEYFLQ